MRVLCPTSLPAALDMLTDAPSAVPMAGGTDLMVHWPQRVADHEATYLDLSGIRALEAMRWTDDALVLGALTTFWSVMRDGAARATFPALAAAASQVGAIQIQSRGTWAGNIANGSPAADGVTALMAYDAVVVLESPRGQREVPLTQFYRGYKDMVLDPDELITEIHIPRHAFRLHRFEKVGARRAQAITKVGLAVTVGEDGWHVVAASVAPTVRRCPAIERQLNDGPRVENPDDLLEAIRQDVAPIDDMRSTAAYRERVLARLLFHLVNAATP